MPRSLDVDPIVSVGEPHPNNAGATICVQLGPASSARRLTAAQARELRDRLTAAIERVESGVKLPPFPKRVKGPKS